MLMGIMVSCCSEPSVSESFSARIASVQPNISISCAAEHNSGLSTANPAHLSSKLVPEISCSSLQESLTPGPSHLVASVAISDIPTSATERVHPVRAEFPPELNTDLSDATPLQFSEGNCAFLAAGTTFAGTGVGAVHPIIPPVNHSVQFQGQILPHAPSTHIQHLTTPSSSNISLSTQDSSAYSRNYDNGKGNSTVISEKMQENYEVKEEAPKGFLPRLSHWFCEFFAPFWVGNDSFCHHIDRTKFKSPSRRERERETSGTSKEPEESPERRNPFSRSEQEPVPSLLEDERNHRSHVVGGVAMGTGIDKEATEHQASSDIDRPPIAQTRTNSTMPHNMRERLSTAFVGTGTLPHQSLHQLPATTIRAPVGDNPGLYRHHPSSHSPVISKHVPTHFDETIRPLPDRVEKRSSKELPSQEKSSGSRVGIGSVPGAEDEKIVALGPDEKYGISES